MIIYGPRGSGKTSLARVFGDYADQQNVVVIYLICEDGATFFELITAYLRALPPSALSPAKFSRFRNQVNTPSPDFGPRAFVELVGDVVISPVVFILDEFDRLQGDTVKAEVATAMKMLSDSFSEVLLMLVGIAETVDDVVGAHPSLRRHLRTVPLSRIPAASVETLVDHSSAPLGLHFSETGRDMIVRAAYGSPYHVRLFCLYSALSAVHSSDQTVEAQHVLVGLRNAFVRWSAMNEMDSQTFIQIAQEADTRRDAERLVREMTGQGAIAVRSSSDFARVVELLEPALVPDQKTPSRLRFRDASAPQFLLALLIIIENGAGSEIWQSLALESPHVLVD